MGVKIIIDSTADLHTGFEGRVSCVPLTVNFGEEEFIDRVNMSRQEFYERLAVCKDLPKTSQPTPEAFADAYRAVVEAGDQAVVLTLSSKLSGTYQSANIAAMDFPGQVFVVDTESAAIGAGVLAELAVGYADSGMGAEEIVEKVQEDKKNLVLLAALDTLEYLVRGGRLSKVAGFAGGLLNIKPLITLKDGEIVVWGKARGTKQANAMLNKELAAVGGADPEKPIFAAFSGLNDELLEKYLGECSELIPGTDHLEHTLISGAIGTHVGPGAYAVAFMKR